MPWIIEKLTALCADIGLAPEYTEWAISLLLAAAFVVLLFVTQRCLSFVLRLFASLWAKRSRNQWDDALCEAKVPGASAHLLISIASMHLYGPVFDGFPAMQECFASGTGIYFALAVGGIAFSLLNAGLLIGSLNDRLKDVPIKGFFQALKILISLAVAIWILSILSDKSPAYFLSGLGALMAILLIVFKDTLLGFTAGILISANDLVRNGDWIEIPGMQVDGTVFDVSLTTVKVRNWDNTIANVPAYALISGAFKNWRGMEKSGGRRIKRAIFIDMQTVHFGTPEEIAHWKKIDLLKPYLDQKLKDIEMSNSLIPAESGTSSPANIRKLTNLGTFRAYCVAYLKAHPKVHQGMTLLVRQRDPGPSGIPMEIYVFTNDTAWVAYEDIQSDIFDHLLAVISEFGLEPYQNPSGRNFEEFLRLK